MQHQGQLVNKQEAQTAHSETIIEHLSTVLFCWDKVIDLIHHCSSALNNLIERISQKTN
jgi:hypothetical protein